jgi:hypothetical protein
MITRTLGRLAGWAATSNGTIAEAKIKLHKRVAIFILLLLLFYFFVD